MARRIYLLVALLTFSILMCESAHACSCDEPGFKTKQARDQYERKWMRQIWPYLGTLVLVRTVTASPVKDLDSQRATLLVVRAWKGPYKPGDQIESYTEGIGGGMCETTIPRINPFLLYFNGAVARIAGCPSDFVPTPAKSRELDRLKAAGAKATKKRS